MARILAIDYGLKRVGLAVSDPLRIIATPLDIVENEKIEKYLIKYFEAEAVDCIVLGEPISLKGGETHSTHPVKEFFERLKVLFPLKDIKLLDERFTSKIALNAMIMGGTKKKYRKEKGNIDKISAVLILQDYLSRQEK